MGLVREHLQKGKEPGEADVKFRPGGGPSPPLFHETSPRVRFEGGNAIFSSLLYAM